MIKMSTTPISTSFASIISLALVRIVNTGDRALDNSIIAFILAINTAIFAIIADEDLYNKFIYYIVDRPSDPLNIRIKYYRFKSLIECATTKGVKNLYNIYKTQILYRFSNVPKEYPKIAQTSCYHIINDHYYNGKSDVLFVDHESSSAIHPIYIHNGEFVYLIVYKDSSTKCMVCYLLSKSSIAIEKAITILNLRNVETKEIKQNTSLKIYDGNGERVKGSISTHKTFDTLYYDQKPTLLRILEKFKTKTMYPNTISMDNKLGILLYGPPGTGKTGTISAIANYLQRDVMIINFASMTGCELLDKLLSEENIKKYIFVFDEFDCILDVIMNRKEDSHDSTQQIDWTSILAVSEKEERQKILDMMRDSVNKNKKPDKIDLGYLLQKLDGIEDNNDRIIIATTNHPENINPALLRPGRFDLKLCLGNCSAQMYENILTSFFNGDNDTRLTISRKGLTPGKWSPLQVINTAIVNETLDATLSALK
jgi:DNA replication protein DnaC